MHTRILSFTVLVVCCLPACALHAQEEASEVNITVVESGASINYQTLLAIERPFSVYFQSGVPSAEFLDVLKKSNMQVVSLGLDCTDETLAAFGQFADLERISFSNAFKINGSGLESVKNLKNWRSADFYLTRINGENLAHLHVCEDLEYIKCPQRTMDDDGIANLVNLPKLATVDLDNTSVTAIGMETLASIQTLQKLYLNGDRFLDDKAFSKLAKAKNLKTIRSSHERRITRAGLMSLVELESLEELRLDRSLITKEDKEEFQKLRPAVEFTGDVFEPDHEKQIDQIVEVLSHGAWVMWADRKQKNEFSASLYAFDWIPSDAAYKSLAALKPDRVRVEVELSDQACEILTRLPAETKISFSATGKLSPEGRKVLQDHFGENVKLPIDDATE